MIIEKDIPPPPRGLHLIKYPWADMEIGDSFFVTGVSRNSMSMTARYQTQKTGKSYTARKVEGGVRVWRDA